MDGIQAASVADNGVGSINAGGLAAMLDAYKDWSTRRLAVVDQQQRTMHFDVMNAESEINRARKAYALCQQRAKATAEHIAQSTFDLIAAVSQVVRGAGVCPCATDGAVTTLYDGWQWRRWRWRCGQSRRR